MNVKRGQSNAIIVIFGAAVRPDGRPSQTLRRRVAAAHAFGRRQAAPIYLPTGGIGRHGPSEASVMAELLGSAGVPGDRIWLEETGTDTLSSVRAVTRIVRQRADGRQVYVATSLYHLPRCVMLLRLAGVAALACPPPANRAPFAERWFWRLREAAALPYDAVLMLALRLARRA